MPQKMICTTCGSDDVKRDAWAVWSVEKQDWILDNVFDYAYCEKCESECSITEIKIEENAQD
jgi:hypothetical protein